MDQERKRTIKQLVRVSLVLLVALLVAFAVFQYSIQPTRINDPARYTQLLASFPGIVTPHIPKMLPEDATGTELHYEAISGLGPSSYRLEVRFNVSPARAGEIFAAAKSARPTAADTCETKCTDS